MVRKFTLLLVACISLSEVIANNLLIQNVTTTGDNSANKTIQVQFDISWDNSWRDDINWDAAWIFVKFKDGSGIWQHALLNNTGFVNGTGTPNSIQPTSDKVGAWIYRSGLGTGPFNSTGIQLQWDYGASSINSVTGLEVRVFAVEMVYVPEGEFNVAKGFVIVTNNLNQAFNGNFSAPGYSFPVINQRLTPPLTYSDGTTSTLRIKGDTGIDTNNDGVVDNTTYPTGYRAFYSYKYELTEQQYADFLNTLTPSQIVTLGLAGTGITLTNGQYFSNTPNKACGNSTAPRLFAYADWSGVRPLSLLEFNKESYGPLQPIFAKLLCCPEIQGYPAWGSNNRPASLPSPNNSSQALLSNVGYNASSTSTRISSGASYYGIMDLTWNASEPVVKMNSFSFNAINGNGVLSSNGNADVPEWLTSIIIYVDQNIIQYGVNTYGFRYVRSAE